MTLLTSQKVSSLLHPQSCHSLAVNANVEDDHIVRSSTVNRFIPSTLQVFPRSVDVAASYKHSLYKVGRNPSTVKNLISTDIHKMPSTTDSLILIASESLRDKDHTYTPEGEERKEDKVDCLSAL